jgi:hypothetical protein
MLTVRERSGMTILELTVVLTLGALAFGTAATVAARAQRFHREIGGAAERLDQVDQTVALLGMDLRAVAPGEGDISDGQARDTALQFRATIGSAVVCDTAGGHVALAPASTTPPQLSAFLVDPAVGDTVWSLSTGAGELDRWTPRPIVGVAGEAGRCVLGGVDVHGVAPTGSRYVLTLAAPSVPAPLGIGAPVRVTRLVRYSLYRASDGLWYLGLREWNPTTAKFNTTQPLSGPFLSAARGGLAFRYLDTAGAVVASGAMNTRAIALVMITLRSDSGGARGSLLGTGSAVASFSIAPRNRIRP